MTTLPGLASKGEKGKQKFQSLDINSLYRVSRGENLEPSAAKSTVPRKHGMQSLGKVPSARRPPANLPSLKSETSGSDAAVSLVPPTGAGPTWGSTGAQQQQQQQQQQTSTSAPPSNLQTPVATSPHQTTSPQSASSSVTSVNVLIVDLQTPTSNSANSTQGAQGGLTPHQAAIALPVTTTIPPPSKQTQQSGSNQQPIPLGSQRTGPTTSQVGQPVTGQQSQSTADKSWSAVMTGSDLPGVGQPPPYQSAQFQHEFPSLSGGPAAGGAVADGGGGQQQALHVTVQRGGAADTQYGPGPSLRPQTEGSWMQGGCGTAGETGVAVQMNAVPPAHHIQQPPPPQFRGLIPPFMFRGNYPPNGPSVPQNQQQQPSANFPGGSSNTAAGGGNFIPPSQQQQAMAGPRGRYSGTGRPPAVLDELAQRPIIKEEDLNRMDDMTRDPGWATHDDIDYNQKLAFSDDETAPDPAETRKESRHSSVPKDIEKQQQQHIIPSEQPIDHKVTAGVPQPQRSNWNQQSRSNNAGGQMISKNQMRAVEDEEVWLQRRRQHSEKMQQAVERARQRKEEEEKRYQEARSNATKKLMELEKKLSDEKTIDGKALDSKKGTINPATIPPQTITPAPIPVPDWERERESRERPERPERERENRDNRDANQSQQSVTARQPISDFRQLTQIEGRSLIRNDSRNIDRDRDRVERDRERDRGDRGDRDRERDRESRDSRERDRDLPRTERERDRDLRERDGPNFSKQFQSNLPPRFQKQQAERHRVVGGTNASGGSGSPQPPQQTNVPFAQQYDPRTWMQSNVHQQQQSTNRRHRNDSSDLDKDDDRRDFRRDRHTPDDARYGGRLHRQYSDRDRKNDSHDVRDNRDNRDRDLRDNRESRDGNREIRDLRDSSDTRGDNREVRNIRNDGRDIRESRTDSRDSARDGRDLRESKDIREPRDGRETRDSREPRDSREKDFRDLRDAHDSRDSRDGRYYDDYRNMNYRNQEYDYEKRGRGDNRDRDRDDSDRWERDKERHYDDRESKQESFDRDRDNKDEWREDRRGDDGRRDEIRRGDRDIDTRRHIDKYDREERRESRDERREVDIRRFERDDRYRDERPQRPDSRDSRTSRESRHSRDSMRDSETREFTGLWADTPFEPEERKKDSYREERRNAHGPITREKMEADELRNEKKTLVQLKRTGTIQQDSKKVELKKSDEKLSEKKTTVGDDGWTINNKKENAPVRGNNDSNNSPKEWADAVSPSTVAPENAKLTDNLEKDSNKSASIEKLHKKTENIKEEHVSESDSKKSDKEMSESNKEKEDKRTRSSHSRGGRDGRGSRNWGGSGYNIYRGSWGTGSRRGPPVRMGINRTSSRSGEYRTTDSEELSADEVSVSTESGKEDRSSKQMSHSPKLSKKLEKEEKNREVKQEKTSTGTVDRNREKQRSYESSVRNTGSGGNRDGGFIPRGEPSRRGRGGGGFRSRGTVGKRIDGYGPPPSKSPFGGQQSQHNESDKEKKNSGDEIGGDIFSSDEKTKVKQQALTAGIIGSARNQSKSGNGSQIPPRMQRKSESESRRDRSKSARGTSGSRRQRSKAKRQTNNSDAGDDNWETTSDNSDESDRKEGGNERKTSVTSKSSGNGGNNNIVQRQNSGNSLSSSNAPQNRGRSMAQITQNSMRAPGTEKRTGYQGRNSNTSQPGRQNSSGNLRSNQNSQKSTTKDVTVNRLDEIKLNDPNALSNALMDLKIKDKKDKDGKKELNENNENISSGEGQEGSDDANADGFQEVRSKKNVKERQKDEKPLQQQSTQQQQRPSERKTEKESNSSNRKSNNKPNGPASQLTPQQIANISSMLAMPVNAPSNMSMSGPGGNKNQFDRPRQSKLPPRFAKQRENSRLQKVQMQQSICDVNEMNKLNQSVSLYAVKDGGPSPAPIPQVNAWDKPITAQLRTSGLEQDQINMSMDNCVDLDHAQQSGASSQRSSPNTDKIISKMSQVQEKAVLDGTTPPVNTIIFENTNYKSAPGSATAKFNNHVKNTQRIDKGRKMEDGDIDNSVLGFNKPMSEIMKSDNKPDPIQLPLSFNKAEDSADMKLDFTFDSELSQLTDDKSGKGLGLPRSIHAMTSAQSTISPSTAELNLKIASVKKVWESMPTVIEHSGTEDGTVNTTASFASALDPSNAFSKSGEPGDENHEVYSPSPSHSMANAVNSTTNVCKVKPTQQQTAGNPPTVAQHHAAAHVNAPTVPGTAPGAAPHMGTAAGQGHPLSPPPVPVMGLGQPPQGYTNANQHINYQPNLGGSAQYGGISAIPSPPTVLFNSSQQIPAQGGLYGAFQMDQGRSQFSQFPPAPYGLGQTASSPYNAQSMYIQTPPHPPPSAQPDMYQSISSQYRMTAAGPFGQSQQLSNSPSTVLISSTSNSLMSASVKPSSQQIGAIGTKAGAVGQAYGAQSQQGGQLYIPYDPSLQAASYMQRGPAGPVQSSVVPAPIQASNSYYSASAGGQTGFYQQPGSSTLQSAPLHQHQTAGFGLQTNVFGGSVHSNSAAAAAAGALQSFGSQFLSSPLQMAAALSAQQQQYRTQPSAAAAALAAGVPTNVSQQQVQAQQQQNVSAQRPQQLKSPGGGQAQQDMLASVFNSAPQIPSPKSRQNCKQPPPQPSPTQHKYNSPYQNVGAQQQSPHLMLQQQQQQNNRQQNNINVNVSMNRAQLGQPTARYPTPIQRPVAAFQQAPGAMTPGASQGGGGGQRHRSQQQQQQQQPPQPQRSQPQQRQYYSGQGGNVPPPQVEKPEETKINESSPNTSAPNNVNPSSNSNIVNKAAGSNDAGNITGQSTESGKENSKGENNVSKE